MITILLLSHNNPAHLKRALSYYKQVEFKGRILIADSSRDELKQQVKDIVAAVEERLFAPVLLEYDSSFPFAHKVARATQEVVTQYTLLAGVDDFFFPEFVYEGMWFLRQNCDYQFVYGKMYGFTFDRSTVSFYYTGYFDKLLSFSDEDALARMKGFFPRYNASFYAVFRTNFLQDVAKRSSEFTQTLVIFDNLFMLVALFWGKGKFLEKPFHWRELSDASYGMLLHEQWLLSETFLQDKIAMKKTLEKCFIDGGTLSDEAVRRSDRLVDEFIAVRFKLTFPKNNKMVQRLKERLPQGLRSFLLRPYYQIKNYFIDAGERYLCRKTSLYKKELYEMAAAIKASGVSTSRKDLRFVKRVRLT